MSKNPASPSVDAKAWFQELKSNRRTQAALLAFAAVITYIFWPEPPKKARRPGGAAAPGAASLDPRQLQSLKRLPDLAKLDRAGQLPDEEKVHRDLFLFEGAAVPPVHKEAPNLIPIPPPSPEEQAQKQLAADKAAELNSKPASLRYLGYLESTRSGRLASFMKADGPVLFSVGAVIDKRWKLTKILDKKAEFQNLKYQDLVYALEISEGGGPAQPQAVTNEF